MYIRALIIAGLLSLGWGASAQTNPEQVNITVTGQTGPAGPAGEAGVAGPAGPAGPTGPQGATGATGPAGADSTVPGPVGPAGATGPAGPQGVAGADGAQGPAGPAGPQGVAGPTGPTGATGATGATGPTGPQGPQGVPGVNGSTWLSGTVDPTAGQGVDGDFYLNTVSKDVFKKISGSWVLQMNLASGGGGGGVALPGDVVDSNGVIVAAAYQDMATKMSLDAGIPYRYGPSSSTPLAGAPTHYERFPSTFYTLEQRPAGDLSNMGQWQVGGPATTDPGDYFSTMSNVLYIGDSAARHGVADVMTISQQHNTFQQKPELPWFQRSHLGGGVDDYHAMDGNLKNPVAAARCLGRHGWCNEGLVVYQNGAISTMFGSNTAQNRATTQLAANKVPTGIAITNANEFALITVWDTVELKGQIAVVAIAGLSGGATPENPDIGDVGWGDWGALHPGLANLGNTAYLKVLGYVDLPANMKAPSEIAVTTGWNPWDGRIYYDWGGYASAYIMDLETEANRQTYISGTNVNAMAKQGVAIVLSKSEKRVAFIDLKPLLDFYKTMYFGSLANFQATQNWGPAGNQWPYTFANTPSQTPTLIKTVDLPSKPTAVRASNWGAAPARAYIATEDGNLRLFSLGNYGKPTGTAVPADIAQVGTVAVGANPTSISHYRGVVNDTLEHTDVILVLSRTEKKVSWITLAGDRNSGTVTKTLTDSRMIDPIAMEDNENHGTHGLVVTVADYTGGTVRNYRYSNVIFWTNQGGSWTCQPPTGCGMGASGTDEFEYGGHLVLPPTLDYYDGSPAPDNFPGKPFFITSANVP